MIVQESLSKVNLKAFYFLKKNFLQKKSTRNRSY